MTIFTVAPDLLRNIEEGEYVFFSDILFVFSQQSNPFRVTKDKNGDVISIYSGIKENADIIKTWLDLMANKPSPFEKIDIDISDIECEETKFVKICKETKGQNQIIFYSRQNIRKFICESNIIQFEGKSLTVFDKFEAQQHLTKTDNSTINYINSQIAKDGSQINDSTNN